MIDLLVRLRFGASDVNSLYDHRIASGNEEGSAESRPTLVTIGGAEDGEEGKSLLEEAPSGDHVQSGLPQVKGLGRKRKAPSDNAEFSTQSARVSLTVSWVFSYKYSKGIASIGPCTLIIRSSNADSTGRRVNAEPGIWAADLSRSR